MIAALRLQVRQRLDLFSGWRGRRPSCLERDGPSGLLVVVPNAPAGFVQVDDTPCLEVVDAGEVVAYLPGYLLAGVVEPAQFRARLGWN